MEHIFLHLVSAVRQLKYEGNIILKKDTKIKIGKKLGVINFKKGCYVYVGSAMNSLEARVKRHLSDNKKKHWHVDYFLLNENTEIKKVYTKESNEKLECI